MQERINDLRDIYSGYSGIVKKLYKEAAKQGNRKAMDELRRVWDRLQQGPIRAMVVGVSSAGKSTMLNALAGNIVAPEGSHTTSPVPVWIYSDGRNKYDIPLVRIFETAGEHALPSAADNNIGVSVFVSTYCYTPEEAGEGCARDPEKYKNVKAAAVNVGGQNNHIYTSGITFVDTPGIGVSIGDDTRVEDVISGGCEFAIVVFKSLNESEPKEFLRKQFVDKNAPLGRVLRNNRVFAVHNCISSSTNTTEVEKRNLEAVFGDRLRNKLFEINARYVRNEKAGTYDYLGLLPGGTTDEVLEDAEKQQKSEKTDIASIENNNSLKELLEKSRQEFDNLWVDLVCGVKRLLDKPEELLIPVCGSINGRFRELKVEDAKLKQELNKLNERSFELIKKAHSKESEARKADYDARIKMVQKILGMGADSMLNKSINKIEQRLIKESYEAFIKNEGFRNHRPLADEYNESRQVAMEHITSEQGCHELLNDVIAPRLSHMNDLLRINLGRRYFGSPEIRGMTAKFMDEFAAAKEQIECLEKPISAQEPWCSGDVNEKILRIIADMTIKGVQAGFQAPNLTVRPNMGWYERSLIEACTAAHEKAMKAVAFMNPLTVNSDMKTKLSAFLKEKQQRVAAGGIRGSWTRSGVNVDLEYKFFCPHISAGIKALVTQYCNVCKDTLIKEVEENITKTLLNRLSANYKKTNQQHEEEINSIRKELGI